MITVTVTGWVVGETEKAVFFVWDRQMDRPICLPKSQIRVADDDGGFRDLLAVPLWLAKKNGLCG